LRAFFSYFIFFFLYIPIAQAGEHQCSDFFKAGFLPLAKIHQPVQIAALQNLSSSRIRGLSEFKKKYANRYEEFALDFYSNQKSSENIGLLFLKSIEKVSPELKDLVYHPGIVSRTSEFMEFISTRSSLTAAQALVQFRNELGTKIFYRALYILESDVELLKKNKINMLSRALHNAYQYDPMINFGKLNKYNLFTDLEIQFKSSRGLLPLSITVYPEVALSVAQMTKTNWPDPKRQIYLFKLEIPILDTIIFEPTKKQRITIYKDDYEHLEGLDYNQDVESFLLFGVENSEIKEIIKPDESIYEFKFHY